MIRRIVKKILPERWLARIRVFMDAPRLLYAIDRHLRFLSESQLNDRHNDLLPADRYHAPINRHEMRVFSQNGEDGVLLYLFSTIGTTDRRFIEFGVSDGKECNCANLAINFGWSGLMMDGSERNVSAARRHYQEQLIEDAGRVRISQAFISAENVNQLFRDHGIEGEIDLLSIDIDGNDYWVWKAIDAVTPRLVVIEYNAVFGYEKAVTLRYKADFDRFCRGHDPLCFGASLAALRKLGEEKGYMLVGCDSFGVNAFFVRRDCATDGLAPITPEAAFYPFRDRLHGLVLPDYLERIDTSYLETV